MPIVTIVAGGLLTVLGLLSYFMSVSHSLTALIPLAIGIPLEACGALALRPELRKHAMHGAAGLALLGVLGSAPGAVALLRLLAGEDGAVVALAAGAQAAMFVICLLFLILCIRSFMNARARRLDDRAA
ncbi:MAG: hypothetical protein IT355_03890 [Gemmatimonadaceae bacterium]|nr:hypothetical protein [Gemmatimonadaceae bacterium]